MRRKNKSKPEPEQMNPALDDTDWPETPAVGGPQIREPEPELVDLEVSRVEQVTPQQKTIYEAVVKLNGKPSYVHYSNLEEDLTATWDNCMVCIETDGKTTVSMFDLTQSQAIRALLSRREAGEMWQTVPKVDATTLEGRKIVSSINYNTINASR